MAFRMLGRLTVMFLILAVLSVKYGQCEEVAEEKIVQENAPEGRTFGHHFLKRLSFAMIPLMFKMGMMTTLLITLTIMSTKGLAIGIILLILGISQIIARGYGYIPPLAPAASIAAVAPPPPAVYPVVYSRAEVPVQAVSPVVHKIVHTAHAHAYQPQAAHVYQPYGNGWDRSASVTTGYSHGPYGREGTDSMEEYETENKMLLK